MLEQELEDAATLYNFTLGDTPASDLNFSDTKTYARTLAQLDTTKLKLRDSAFWAEIETLPFDELDGLIYEYLKGLNLNNMSRFGALIKIFHRCFLDDTFSANEPAQTITGDEFVALAETEQKNKSGKVASAELLKRNNSETVEKIHSLCNQLGIASHPNPVVMLEAAELFITEHLSDEALEKYDEIEKSGRAKKIDFKKFPTGYHKQDDKVLDTAVRCLRLLSIEYLREKQNLVNQTLAELQAKIAESK